MSPNDPNVVMMELVAERLGDGLREELVFVGGAVTGLLNSLRPNSKRSPTAEIVTIFSATIWVI